MCPRKQLNPYSWECCNPWAKREGEAGRCSCWNLLNWLCWQQQTAPLLSLKYIPKGSLQWSKHSLRRREADLYPNRMPPRSEWSVSVVNVELLLSLSVGPDPKAGLTSGEDTTEMTRTVTCRLGYSVHRFLLPNLRIIWPLYLIIVKQGIRSSPCVKDFISYLPLWVKDQVYFLICFYF